MSRSPRTIVGLALATFLLMAPWASAAPQNATAPRSGLGQVWGFLTSLFLDAGCIFDPNGGHCAGGSSTPLRENLDIGCVRRQLDLRVDDN
jgi:hypothetical protein